MYNAYNIGSTPDHSIAAVVIVGFLRFCTTNNWIKFQIERKNYFKWKFNWLCVSFFFFFAIVSSLALVRVGIRQSKRIFYVHLFTYIHYRTVLWNERVLFIHLIYSGWNYFSQTRTKPTLIFEFIDLCRLFFFSFFFFLSFIRFAFNLKPTDIVASFLSHSLDHSMCSICMHCKTCARLDEWIKKTIFVRKFI